MMKYFILIFMAMVYSSLSCAQYFVSPDGNDQNSGEAPGKAFATLSKAMSKIKGTAKVNIDKVNPLNIYLMGGTYILDKPIVIKPEQSGSTDRPVIISNYMDQKVVISGGKKISGWIKHKNGLWKTKVTGPKGKAWRFNQLFVNGERRYVARTPNKGFFRVAGFPDGDTSLPYNTGAKRFEFAKGDLNANWKNPKDIRVIVYHFWTDSHLKIEAINKTSNIVTFQDKSGKIFTDDFTKKGARYVVENFLEALDTPGEWYLDAKTDELFYMPMPGEDMANAEVWAPVISEFIRMEGYPLKGEYVENIHFKGITFSCVEGILPTGSVNDDQAADDASAAITMKGVRNCSFENCSVKNVGGYVFDIGDGCENNRFKHNSLSHIGAGGFRMNGAKQDGHPLLRTGLNTISDNRLEHFGEIYASGVGILLKNTYQNTIVHNHIHHGFYTGISVGWEWGYQPSISWGNVISFNHIHDIGQGILSDMGAIYTLGVSPGTVVSNNLIHDIESNNYGGWGIYNDEGSTHILVENNIVYNTKFAGYNIHYAKEITVRNNIFVFGRLQQLSRSRIEPHISVFFERNIVYWKTGKLLDGQWKDKPYQFHFNPITKDGNRQVGNTFEMDWNMYFNPTLPVDSVQFNGRSWKEWQEARDKNSLYQDPLFVNPDNYDFRLKPASPAYSLGFKDIDMSKVGPRE